MTAQRSCDIHVRKWVQRFPNKCLTELNPQWRVSHGKQAYSEESISKMPIQGELKEGRPPVTDWLREKEKALQVKLIRIRIAHYLSLINLSIVVLKVTYNHGLRQSLQETASPQL